VEPCGIPEDPLGFIRKCVQEGRVFWTYHVNMRSWQRSIPTAAVVGSVGSFEIIEEYPRDKYLPSYLVRAVHKNLVFHVHIATDVVGDSIRIVTAYVPDPSKWDTEFRRRRLR
jgi:hypothetical protein